MRRDVEGPVSDVHCGRAALRDLVGVTAEAKHRHASPIALLLKKGSAWHGAWSKAHLTHDPRHISLSGSGEGPGWVTCRPPLHGTCATYGQLRRR